MRKLFFVLTSMSLIFFYACDDGEVLNIELDFEDSFQACGDTDLVLYKTKNDPSESLSLVLKNTTLNNILEIDDSGVFEKTYTISTSNPFNYRTYSNIKLPSNLFCNAVPNSEVKITQDYESTSGTADLKTVLTEDDNDGIPAEFEDLNNNGNLDDDDTDGDGLPNYIDADDDGDNILTRNEDTEDTDLSVDSNGDGDPTNDKNGDGNPLNDDTDKDGIPDYLDSDDDGDGIDTRDEENDSQDLNPANDITFSADGPDYLNKNVANIDTPKATAYREHTISQTYLVTLSISNFNLTLISLDVFDFGALEDSELTSSRKVTPDFN